jgi:hypothetical protein
MRKLFILLLILSASILSFSQDIKKIAEDFEKSMKDPKVLYGHNKAV